MWPCAQICSKQSVLLTFEGIRRRQRTTVTPHNSALMDRVTPTLQGPPYLCSYLCSYRQWLQEQILTVLWLEKQQFFPSLFWKLEIDRWFLLQALWGGLFWPPSQLPVAAGHCLGTCRPVIGPCILIYAPVFPWPFLPLSLFILTSRTGPNPPKSHCNSLYLKASLSMYVHLLSYR